MQSKCCVLCYYSVIQSSPGRHKLPARRYTLNSGITAWGSAEKNWENCVSSEYCKWLFNCNEHGVETVFAASSASISTWYTCKNRTHYENVLLRELPAGAQRKVRKIAWVQSIANQFRMVNGVKINFSASGASISTWYACEKRTHYENLLLRERPAWAKRKVRKIVWVQGIANIFWTMMSTAQKLILLHWVLQSPRDTGTKIQLTIKIYCSENRLQERKEKQRKLCEFRVL